MVFGDRDFLELVDDFGARLLKIADGCRAHGLHSRETRRHGPLIGFWHGLSRSGDHEDDQLRDGQEDEETVEERRQVVVLFIGETGVHIPAEDAFFIREILVELNVRLPVTPVRLKPELRTVPVLIWFTHVASLRICVQVKGKAGGGCSQVSISQERERARACTRMHVPVATRCVKVTMMAAKWSTTSVSWFRKSSPSRI